MAGQIRTLTRVVQPTTNDDGAREIFATIVQYFNEHPNFQRIASKYGTNGTGLGSALLFSGSSGEQAFAVFRTLSSSVTYDVSVCWSWTTNYTVGTWTGTQTYGAGLMLAFHSSSAAWSGSVNNNGNDAFFTSSKPWKAGSIVFPRGNSTGGTWATNMNAPLKMGDLTVNQLWQLTVLGDDETTYMFAQSADASLIGDARHFWAFGKYAPLTSSYNLPLFMLGAYTLDPIFDIGNPTNETIASYQNGGIAYVSGTGTKTFRLSYLLNAPRRAPRPAEILYGSIGNNYRSYGFPVQLSSYESGHYHQLGILSGVYVVGASAFGNLQDVSRSLVTFKIENNSNSRNISLALPFSGSIDFFLRGAFE